MEEVHLNHKGISNSNSSKSSINSSPLSLNTFQNSNQISGKDFIELIDENVSSKFDMAIESSLDYLRPSAEGKSTSNIINQIDLSALETLKPLDAKDIDGDLLNTDTVLQIPLELFDTLNDAYEKYYLDVFYHEFSHVILPLEPSNDMNPIRDILLQYSLRKDYLFYAILATGARYSFKKRLLNEDQEFYSKFMKGTLEMLNDLILVKDFIPDPENEVEMLEITKKVEILLLTILILTSDNASSMKQSWRGHLKGAKELLYKAFILKRFSPHSKILIFCKLWFTSFEVLACLTAPRGGTIKDNFESKLLMFDATNYEELKVLEKMKLITKEGYNLLIGYHNKVLLSLVKLIDIMKLCQSPLSLDNELSESVFQLISEFNNNQHLSMMKNVPPSAISTYRNASTGDVKTISWYDICHESHVDAGLITIMVNILSVPNTNIIIQDLVRKILSRFHVLNRGYRYVSDGEETNIGTGGDHKKLFSLMLLQWPLLVAGLNCLNDQDKYEVESLFQLLDSLGSGSSRFALKKIKKVWNNETGLDDVDIVTY